MGKNVILTPFIGGSFETQYKMVSPSLTMNMYVNPEEAGYTDGSLKSIDGNEAVTDFPNDLSVGCRGLFIPSRGPGGRPDLYTVYDNTLFRVKPGARRKYAVGSLDSTAGPVSFAESGGIRSQVVMENGTRLSYVCSALADDDHIEDTLRSVPNPVNPYNPKNKDIADIESGVRVNSDCIVEINGRLVINDTESGQIFFSRVGAFQGGDVKVYDLTDDKKIKYEADGYTPKYRTVPLDDWSWKDDYGSYMYMTPLQDTGDIVRAMEVINNKTLFVFGDRSYAILQAQNEDYDLTNTMNGSNIGILAAASLAKVDNELLWLGAGDDGHSGVWKVSLQGAPERVSTLALDREIQTMRESRDAFAFAYTYSGHEFYVISFPSADKTFVYDLRTKCWMNFSTRDAQLDIDHMWYPVFAKQWNGDIYFGNYNENVLMRMVPDKFTEWDGRPIRRLRRSPCIVSDLSYFIVNEVRVEGNVGCTPVDQPQLDGFNPHLMARFSADGGNAWSQLPDSRFGRKGSYGHLCNFLGLGLARYGVLELSVTDPVDLVIVPPKIRYTETSRF